MISVMYKTRGNGQLQLCVAGSLTNMEIYFVPAEYFAKFVPNTSIVQI